MSFVRVRRCNRRYRLYPCVRCCWTLICLGMISTIFVFVFYDYLIYYCSTRSSTIIVSLTSTPRRFQYELPIAIYSLLSQILLPSEIRIYLTSTTDRSRLSLKSLKQSIEHFDGSLTVRRLFDQLVRIHWIDDDYGPATKYLPIIREYHSATTRLSQDQTIIICDDDHYYHPHVIETLDRYGTIYNTSIVGLRGWRGEIDILETQTIHSHAHTHTYVIHEQ
jgi:hypothetical protein